MAQLTHCKTKEPQKQVKKRKHSTITTLAATPDTPTAAANEFDDSSVLAPPPILVPTTSNRLATSAFEFHTTRSYPMNRGGYRYTSCGPSLTSLPYLSTPVYRTIPTAPEGVRFAWEDRSPFVLITEDGKTIEAEKGWRAARGNVSMREGNWYWEVKVERGGGEGGRETEMKKGKEGEGEGSWVRIGVGRRESSISAPAGIDGSVVLLINLENCTNLAIDIGIPTPTRTDQETLSHCLDRRHMEYLLAPLQLSAFTFHSPLVQHLPRTLSILQSSSVNEFQFDIKVSFTLNRENMLRVKKWKR